MFVDCCVSDFSLILMPTSRVTKPNEIDLFIECE